MKGSFSLPLFPPASARTAPQPPPPLPALPQAQPRPLVLWLALHWPDWPLQALMQKEAQNGAQNGEMERGDVPTVVIADDRFRSVLCADTAARRYGVHPGQRLNTAIALYAGLRSLPRQPALEQRLLDALATRCQRFTTTVVVGPDNELALELRGSLRLFGGLKALVRAVKDDLQRQGLAPAMALAATLRSAQWLARGQAGEGRHLAHVTAERLAAALSKLPLQVLGWPEELLVSFQRCGIATLGDLLRLPRDGLTRRIGQARLLELDQALGREAEVFRAHPWRESFHDRVLLDADLASVDVIEALLLQRLAHLERFLIRRQTAVSGIDIRLQHRDAPPTPLRIGLARPTADMKHLASLLHEALGGLRLPAPVREIVIEVPHPALQAAENSAASELSECAQNPVWPVLASVADRARLLERLRMRLGAARIRSLACHADHRPERAQCEPIVSLSVTSGRAVRARDMSSADHFLRPLRTGENAGAGPDLPPRPLWLLREPRRLEAVRFLRRLRGPERIQSGWWDGAAVDRDYYLAQAPGGALWWVYRDRAGGQWWLHGLFA